MSAEQVIKLGNKSMQVSISDIAQQMNTFNWIGMGLLLVGILFLIISRGGRKYDFLGFVSLIFLLIGSINLLFVAGYPWNIQNEQVQVWKEDVVKPYILSLPEERGELLTIQTTGSMEVTVSNDLSPSNTTATMRLTYKSQEGTIVSSPEWMEGYMVLDDTKPAYVTYRHLSLDLGNGVNPGNYEVVVHLSSRYPFTL